MNFEVLCISLVFKSFLAFRTTIASSAMVITAQAFKNPFVVFVIHLSFTMKAKSRLKITI